MRAGTAQNTLHALTCLILKTNKTDIHILQTKKPKMRAVAQSNKAFKEEELKFKTDYAQSSIFA